MKMYVRIANLIFAIQNCQKSNNTEWESNHRDSLDELMKQFPHGSGFDSGTKIEEDRCTPEKLIFTTAFHHMNENGYYDGWTHHEVRITPSLWQGYTMRITGKNKRDIKSYIEEIFDQVLNREV